MFPEVSFVSLLRVMHMVPLSWDTFPQLPVVLAFSAILGKGNEILLLEVEASFKAGSCIQS